MKLRIAAAAGAAFACMLVTSNAAAQGDAARGKGAYAVCVACHGANGEGNKELSAPRIAGQSAVDVARQIDNFRKGARGYDPQDVAAMQMKAIALTLPNAQAIEDVAAYVATLTAPRPAATVAGNAAAGAASYAICAACHGPAGEGNPAQNAPKLAGQHDWYVVRQLQHFKSGMRGKGPGDVFGVQMAPMALTLADDAAIANVAAHIATFKE